MPNEEKQCKNTEHNFTKVSEETRTRMDSNWNFYDYKVYIMCCSKCGKIIVVEGSA